MARHTDFQGEMPVPPFPCTIGVEYVTRWRTEPYRERCVDFKRLIIINEKTYRYPRQKLIFVLNYCERVNN